MSAIRPNDPRVKQIAEQCAAVKFGLSPASLQKLHGVSRSQVQRIVRECLDQGLLVLHKIPCGDWHWMTPADKTEFAAIADVAQVERSRALGREYYRKAMAAGKVQPRRVDDAPDWPIERRHVRAGDDPPPKTMAVNSVFALGAA